MYRALCLLFSLFALTACQSNAPLLDFDPTRDFSRYQTWQWQEPSVLFSPDDPRVRNDLTAQRLIQAVEQQLLLQGLPQSEDRDQSDLLIQASISIDTRQEVLRSMHFDHWGHPLYGPVFSDVRTLEYPVRTLQLDIFDARDGRLIWRAALESAPEAARLSPEQRSAAMQRQVALLLQRFPPQ